jgi:tRNA(Ile)-lysidine synthase
MLPTLSERLEAKLHEVSGQQLCVAYSGGLDSTVLLCLLARLAPRLGFDLTAVHVHHGLSPHANTWAGHCERVCATLGVPLLVRRVVVAEHTGKGIEAAAREARHAVLAQIGADWVMLAHHADDQAETLLQRLLRGTGVNGAAAMRERDARRHLWRPLLNERRSVLEAWARAEGLRWVSDDSNADECLTRNFLRHRIVAPLKEHFPSCVDNLARACGHFAEAADLLDDLAGLDAARVGLGQPGARTRLLECSDARLRNLLRHWIGRAGELAPAAQRLDQLVSALRREGAVHWVHGNLALCAYRDCVWCEGVETDAPQPIFWQGEAELPWGTGTLRFLPAEGPDALGLKPGRDRVEIRLRVGGDVVRLAPGRPSRRFKTVCQEFGLPPWWRASLPCVWVNDSLVWIGGIGLLAEGHAEAGERGWRIDWQPHRLRL